MREKDVLQRALSELRELGVMLVIAFFMFLGFSSGEMLQPLHTQFLKIGPDMVGMLFFLSNIASAVVRIPAGVASDKYGRKPIVLAAAASFIAASGLFMVASDFVSLILPFVLWGAAGGFYFTSTNALIADMSKAENRVAAFARVGMVNMMANMVGPLLTGMLADLLGIASAFLVLVITFILMAVSVLRIREPHKEEEPDPENTSILSLIRGSTGPIILTFGVFNLIFGIYGGMYWPAMTIIQKNEFQFSYSEIGLVSTVGMFSQLVGFSLCSKVAKYNPRYVMTAAALAHVGIAFVYPGLRDLSLLLPATFISGFAFSFGILSPIGSSLLMNSLPTSVRGVSQGITGTFWRAGMAIGALAMGIIWDRLNLSMIFYVSGGLLLVEALAIIVALPGSEVPSKEV